MRTGTVELKFRDGTAIIIKGSADFVAAVSTAILEVSKESSDRAEEGEPKQFPEAGKLVYGDSVESHELEAPADHPSRSRPGWMNQRLCWSLREAAERYSVSYQTMYRAVCRGDLKIIKGFGRIMVSDSELRRFIANVAEYSLRKRKTWKTHARR
jgi:helix-turn-helix protein